MFWQDFDQPIVGLAPIDGVSDHPFRYVVKKYGGPDVVFTEFINVEGLCHNAVSLLRGLYYQPSERPIIAQVFGKDPNSFRKVAVLVAELGFNGIDINMGCPAKKVASHGSGAGLIKNPDLAIDIIQAVKMGLKDYQQGMRVSDIEEFKGGVQRFSNLFREKFSKDLNINLPVVSVKTRTGDDEPIVEEWISLLANQKLAAITLHGRTIKQGYSGQADWNLIAKAASIIKRINSKTVFLGNGDVKTRDQVILLSQKYDVDGALIARASFGNPFIFQLGYRMREERDEYEIGKDELDARIKVAYEHAVHYHKFNQLMIKWKVLKRVNFLPIRKHLAWYVKGFRDASKYRSRLVRVDSLDEVKTILDEIRVELDY
jgi:tRNA-dihydrouridine synthase B